MFFYKKWKNFRYEDIKSFISKNFVRFQFKLAYFTIALIGGITLNGGVEKLEEVVDIFCIGYIII